MDLETLDLADTPPAMELETPDLADARQALDSETPDLAGTPKEGTVQVSPFTCDTIGLCPRLNSCSAFFLDSTVS